MRKAVMTVNEARSGWVYHNTSGIIFDVSRYHDVPATSALGQIQTMPLFGVISYVFCSVCSQYVKIRLENTLIVKMSKVELFASIVWLEEELE